MTSAPIRVLVDHCVFLHGQTARHIEILENFEWPTGHKQAMNVLRLRGRRLASSEQRLRAEIPAIAAIGEAARQGAILVLTSEEIQAERFRARMGNRGVLGDLWAGVRFGHIPSPLARCTWMGDLTLAQMGSRDHREEFYRRLVHWARQGIPADLLKWLPHSEYVDAQRPNIARLGEYLAICDAVGETRLGDAFHFWTALCNGVDYFLTTDAKFLGALRERHCDPEALYRAFSPTELVQALDLAAFELPLAEGEVQPYARA
jgi:hypothetical protein